MIELGEQIGRCISPMDVVDARTLLQTPDTTFNRYGSTLLQEIRTLVNITSLMTTALVACLDISAMFPWLRSYPGGLQLSEDSMNSTNGLFFQQLYAYTLIGKRTPMPASQRKEKQNKEAFHSLLEKYVRGSFDDSKHGSQQNGYGYQQQHTPQHAQHAAHRPVPLTPATPGRDAQGRRLSERPPSGASSSSQYKSAQSPSYSAPPRRLEFPPERGDTNSSSDSDNAEDNIPLRVNPSIPSSPYHNSASKYRGTNGGVTSPTSPLVTVSSSPMRRASNENPLDDMENVFDIVFKQQAIGMKLGADETNQFAVVKECFDNSEAARYPEIQNGVVILAVNGQECAGLKLSRILYRLREAPRPVVVRFGRISNKLQLSGTWG